MARHLDRRSFILAGAAATLLGEARPSDGLISLVGYNDMGEMLAALDKAFLKLRPGVRITTDLRGTRFGPDALASGQATLAPMGASFTPKQLAAYVAVAGRAPRGFRIAHASLSPRALSGPNALFVHRDNPLRSISTRKAAELFTRSGPYYWDEIAEEGGLGHRPVKLAGLAPETPLALEFQDALFRRSRFAGDYRRFGQSRDVVEFVGREPEALGFAALNRATELVRPLGINRELSTPPIHASAETLRSGAYPLDRHLWIYARVDGQGRLGELARAYLGFVLSSIGQGIIGAGSLGYLPLGERERRQELARLG